MPQPAGGLISSLLVSFFFWAFIIGIMLSWMFGSPFSTGDSPKSSSTLSVTPYAVISTVTSIITSITTSTITSTSLSISTITTTSIITSWTTSSTSTTSSVKPKYTDLKQGLLAAAAAGSVKDTSYYLGKGVKASIVNSQLRTPLHLAAANGNKDTVKLLIQYKNTGWFADGNTTPLHLAARYGHTEAVKIITKLSDHVWHQERASARKAIEKIRQVVGHKFDKQLKDFYDRKTFSARELATIYGHRDTVLAFPMSSDDDILHALSCACLLGDVEMVEILWFHHAGRSWMDKHSLPQKHISGFPAPPLHLAIMSGDRATVAFLLERGLTTMTGSGTGSYETGYPPYSSVGHYAAIVGSTQLLEALEKRGADLTALDHLKRTVLSYAVEHKNEAAVELLVKRKYPDRGGIFMSENSAKVATYFGTGHVWTDKNGVAIPIASTRIKKALKSIGM